VKLADIDMDYLLTEVLTKKDSQGRSLNSGWRPSFMNGSSNPDGTTGLSLDLAYISGYDYGPPLGIKGILPALLDFQAWGKRYAGTPFEELYISSFTFNNQGSYVYDTTPPPDGDFRVFRKSDTPGITINNFPLTEVKVMSSIERVNPSSADPLDAYRQALSAVIGGVNPVQDLDKYKTCIPVLMWRPRNKSLYGITSAKESQIGIGNFNTFQTLAESTSTASSVPSLPGLSRPAGPVQATSKSTGTQESGAAARTPEKRSRIRPVLPR
jgi:hypothetical protein